MEVLKLAQHENNELVHSRLQHARWGFAFYPLNATFFVLLINRIGSRDKTISNRQQKSAARGFCGSTKPRGHFLTDICFNVCFGICFVFNGRAQSLKSVVWKHVIAVISFAVCWFEAVVAGILHMHNGNLNSRFQVRWFRRDCIHCTPLLDNWSLFGALHCVSIFQQMHCHFPHLLLV